MSIPNLGTIIYLKRHTIHQLLKMLLSAFFVFPILGCRKYYRSTEKTFKRVKGTFACMNFIRNLIPNLTYKLQD